MCIICMDNTINHKSILYQLIVQWLSIKLLQTYNVYHLFSLFFDSLNWDPHVIFTLHFYLNLTHYFL